ncbi:4-hydroxybenzoate octaprenyltransferase (plasmid) [Paroceanicella profunda]|uniref:4-hydroxybenzoate octaprenyltransferase n=1 Tax=Paroceanicella profunda TaxID=2579971 RepID=A0A5B8G4C5_9RHOB|nr:4-hydroxybenzoate octaprenyltransferase [Paroceanicella profunda]QDL94182.1 4-hydroxybenzoate octaprenyltransferase [Paroceanicella profunda]
MSEHVSSAQSAPDGRVADATAENWVDRFCPPWSRPWLRLSRADRPAGTWLLLLPCWWGLGLAMAADPGGPRLADLWIFAGCGLGAFLMRGAGCTWNDISDRHVDGQVARTRSRPIPSGQVSVRGAAGWMVVQALIALAILLSFPAAAIWLGVLSLLPVAVYPFAKRFTWWPQVFLGLAFNWGALLAWAAHAQGFGLPSLALYAAGICWTLFYDTIYAHQDREDDALIGVKSTARLFGENTHAWLAGFLVASVALIGLAVLTVTTGLSLVLCLAGLAGFALHLAWQLRRLDIHDTDLCMRLFRANRDAGLIVALAFGLAGLV